MIEILKKLYPNLKVEESSEAYMSGSTEMKDGYIIKVYHPNDFNFVYVAFPTRNRATKMSKDQDGINTCFAAPITKMLKDFK